MRAEAVSLMSERDLPGVIRLQAEVEAAEADYAHHTQLLQLRTGRLTYPALCSIDTQVNPGDSLPVQLDPARLYFFDQSTGLAL
jgi:hypothetical protein